MKRLIDLPHGLEKQYVDLSPIGINTYAWSIKDTLAILEHWLQADTKLIVLGGDLYRQDDEKIKSALENWYYAPQQREEFSKNSLRKAIKYLEEIQHNEELRDSLVDLVVWEGAEMPSPEDIQERARSQHD